MSMNKEEKFGGSFRKAPLTARLLWGGANCMGRLPEILGSRLDDNQEGFRWR